MTIVSMNKKDRDFCDNFKWVVDGKIVYEADAEGCIIPNAEPYFLDNVFIAASEEEIAQYLCTYGFPWNASYE